MVKKKRMEKMLLGPFFHQHLPKVWMAGAQFEGELKKHPSYEL